MINSFYIEIFRNFHADAENWFFRLKFEREFLNKLSIFRHHNIRLDFKLFDQCIQNLT